MTDTREARNQAAFRRLLNHRPRTLTLPPPLPEFVRWVRCPCGKLHALAGCSQASLCSGCGRKPLEHLALAF